MFNRIRGYVTYLKMVPRVPEEGSHSFQTILSPLVFIASLLFTFTFFFVCVCEGDSGMVFTSHSEILGQCKYFIVRESYLAGKAVKISSDKMNFFFLNIYTNS